jgi:alkaline phosphatase D
VKVSSSELDRRRFLAWLSSTAGIGAATPWLVACDGRGPAGLEVNRAAPMPPPVVDGRTGPPMPPAPPPATTEPGERVVPCTIEPDDGRTFDLSVASGDPSATGVILWTHLRPEAVVAGQPLAFQVAADPAFSSLVMEGQVPAAAIGGASDHTVRVDLDGHLAPGRTYHYRFVYGCRASRTGRCRTLPAAGARSLRLALVTCQDYTNGYYEVFRHLAEDDVDFVLHLGDFIYESAGDPRFQRLPFADRKLILPSEREVAMDLADYRHLYRTYRGDPNLQRALERHTLIAVPDDHETANDCYWDYERDTLGAPDHPLAGDAGALRRLKLDSQRAWSEYVPARAALQPGATHPHQFLRAYRSFDFGDLFRYVALDTRSYRHAHPCGEGDVFQRYVVACRRAGEPMRSILGADQRAWMMERLAAGGALWKVLGNQTFFGRLDLGAGIAINVDAWDGFEAERRWVAEEVRRRQVENLVILTGDLHSYIASTVKVDYSRPAEPANLVGVEFMTPSVTSAALFEVLLQDLRSSPFADGLSEGAVRLNNPHVKFFNSSKHGYSTIELTREHCEWVAWAVDKNRPSGTAREAVARFRKTLASPELVEMPV